MNTGRIAAAQSELAENGYLSDDTLSRLSGEEVVFLTNQQMEQDSNAR